MLRERFLADHLVGSKGITVELGPGPGRFTPILRERQRARVIGVDLSRKSLLAASRRARRRPNLAHVDWIQGAGEHLPFANLSIDTLVALGNIVSFASLETQVLLKELARVAKPQARLILDFPSPASSAQEFFYVAAQGGFLPRVLRRPRYYLVDQVLSSGFQPYAPARLGRWEFRFFTVAEARRELSRAGFRIADVMSVAPIAALQDRIVSIARRNPRTWESLLRIEERLGRRAGLHESGHGFIVAAEKK